MAWFGWRKRALAPVPRAADESQLDYLYRAIDAMLQTRMDSADWFRGMSFWAQMTTTLLSAAITVVAGLKGSWLAGFGITPEVGNAIGSDVVLVLSAIVTVVAAAGAFYAPRELWVVDSVNAGKLHALRDKLQFAERAPDFATQRDEVLATAFAEYQAICEEYNAEWFKLRSKSK